MFILTANNGECEFIINMDTIPVMGITKFRKFLRMLDINENNLRILEILIGYNLVFKNGKFVNTYIDEYLNKFYKGV